MADKPREPDVIEPKPVAENEVDDESERVRETASRPIDVPVTGRTLTNVLRGGRVIV